MAGQPPDQEKVRFEALLSQVLTTEEEARSHRAGKGQRDDARQHAVSARTTFERNRDKPPKQRRRRPRREA